MSDDAIYPSLRGRAVLITGGASGIGESIVEHFARQGARVAFLDIAQDAGTALAERLAAEGCPQPYFRVCDLRDIPAMQRAIEACHASLGDFSVLVNNAGHDERHAWESVTVEYWDGRVAVNLRHQFFAIQAVAPMMRRLGGGSIVNFGSVSWHLGQGGYPAYTSSKAAIEGLTRSFARDLGPDRIRVNCVLPGWIITERQKALWLTPEADAAREQAQCLKGQLFPPDIARMVLWLAADDSRMCTNQTWTVDGGWT
jgi:NAD(P)-dependent dehydrogenase (short-subunit alcohol dehydrogenase family)